MHLRLCEFANALHDVIVLRVDRVLGAELLGEFRLEGIFRDTGNAALAALPEEIDWTPIWLKEINVIGSLTYGTEVFKGKRADTFARAIELVAKRRADLTPVKPRKYPLEQYREALTEAASKKTSGAVKVSFVL